MPRAPADAASLSASVGVRLRGGVSRDEARAALLAIQRRLDAVRPVADRAARALWIRWRF